MTLKYTTCPKHVLGFTFTILLPSSNGQEAKEGTYKEIYKGINRRKNLNVNNYEDGLTMAKNSRYAYIAEKSYLDIKGENIFSCGHVTLYV